MDQQNNKRWGEGVFTLLSWFEMERVKNARVLVVGAGALGNEVLKNLALFGVGNIYVVDFDTIEYSNLTRSILFREEDADKGLFKADVAAQRVREINRNVNVHSVIGRLDTNVGLGLYRSMDVVIGCLDSRLARLQLNRQCIRAEVPWVDGSIENLEGLVRVYKKGVNCYECELPEATKESIFHRMSCADVAHRNTQAGRIPTTPVIASIIGAIQVQEAMKLIHEGYVNPDEFTSLCGSWFKYEGSHMTSRVYKSAIWADDCLAHEDWEPVVSLDNLSADMTVREVLNTLRNHFGIEEVEINLRNTKFVDKLVTKGDNKTYPAMCPEYRVADYIDTVPELYTRLQTDINQNVYENIDSEFPYQNLTLNQVGIPHWDVIQVLSGKGGAYVELAGDKDYYEQH
ncbi:MAG: ThiF family adenylyltransferase [Bacteroidales bacterium]|nr:ThiF family adenylyltransferase [Bacteroidales bacterium]